MSSGWLNSGCANWAISEFTTTASVSAGSRLESTKSMETLDTVNREGRERLYPSLTNPSWLVLRRRREIFRKWLARVDGHDLDVLDVGGRIQPYRPLLEGRVRRYVAVDLRQTPLVNVVGRGEHIPLASAQFDLVICTQVLEYIPEPAAVIAEIHRVLKPGGCLLLSVPAVCPRDADHDCWRFLPGSLRHLLAPFNRFRGGSRRWECSGLFSHDQCLSQHFCTVSEVAFDFSVDPVPTGESWRRIADTPGWQR